MENFDLKEMESLRTELDALKSIIKSQAIVNDKMMRRAMKGDYGKLRSQQIWGIGMMLFAMVFYFAAYPMFGMPMWFFYVTEAFFLVSLVATVYSIYHYLSDDLMACNLTEVAKRLADYKRFGIYWLCFSVPFLVVWIYLFFSVLVESLDSDIKCGAVTGGVIGGVAGTIAGVMFLRRDWRYTASVIRQIEELKKGQLA